MNVEYARALARTRTSTPTIKSKSPGAASPGLSISCVQVIRFEVGAMDERFRQRGSRSIPPPWTSL